MAGFVMLHRHFEPGGMLDFSETLLEALAREHPERVSLPRVERQPIKLTLADFVNAGCIRHDVTAKVKQIAELFGYTIEDIKGKRRDRAIVGVRSLVYKVMVTRGAGFAQVGRWLDRDHSTVIHGFRTFEKHAEERPELKEALEVLTADIRDAEKVIKLPFPPASLSGHAKGHWRAKSTPTKKYRAEAKHAAKKAGFTTIPGEGDIHVHITFYPPDRRGDRVNFPNRCKPLFDGIADALGVNDKRFVPHFTFKQPCKPGRVEVRIG